MPFFVDRDHLREVFHVKRIAIVGSGPGSLDNEPGFIDSHDVVVRINNYKPGFRQGSRCDVFYSFFGGSIKKDRAELENDGVKLCVSKCPDAKFMESEWHRKMCKPHGVDFRYIYEHRRNWWFCPTYVPSFEEFSASFELLGKHIPSTGFSALLLVKSFEPESIYLTGFDFFSSRVHNVNEPWRPGNPSDPIGHAPELERAWLAANQGGISFDPTLARIMGAESAA